MNNELRNRDKENLMNKDLSYLSTYHPTMRELALLMLSSGDITESDFCLFTCMKSEKVKRGYLLSVWETKIKDH